MSVNLRTYPILDLVRLTSICEREEKRRERNHFQECRNSAEPDKQPRCQYCQQHVQGWCRLCHLRRVALPSIRPSVLLKPLRLLRCGPLLELEILECPRPISSGLDGRLLGWLKYSPDRGQSCLSHALLHVNTNDLHSRWTSFSPCKRMKITVPTTRTKNVRNLLGWYGRSQTDSPGMKFNGKYMTYRIMPLRLNRSNGFFRILPSLWMGSPPDLSCRPSLTRLVAFFDTSVPSKVSSSASWTMKFLDKIEIMVELSLRIRSTVVNTASGPLTKTSTASCGT